MKYYAVAYRHFGLFSKFKDSLSLRAFNDVDTNPR
jgi:hypothetical protein